LSVPNFHFRVLFGAALAAAEPQDQTQQVDPAELKQIVGNGSHKARDIAVDSSFEQPIVSVQQNALPDVYPDDKKG
jgi:hypothetical protein